MGNLYHDYTLQLFYAFTALGLGNLVQSGKYGNRVLVMQATVNSIKSTKLTVD